MSRMRAVCNSLLNDTSSSIVVPAEKDYSSKLEGPFIVVQTLYQKSCNTAIEAQVHDPSDIGH